MCRRHAVCGEPNKSPSSGILHEVGGAWLGTCLARRFINIYEVPEICILFSQGQVPHYLYPCP